MSDLCFCIAVSLVPAPSLREGIALPFTVKPLEAYGSVSVLFQGV